MDESWCWCMIKARRRRKKKSQNYIISSHPNNNSNLSRLDFVIISRCLACSMRLISLRYRGPSRSFTIFFPSRMHSLNLLICANQIVVISHYEIIIIIELTIMLHRTTGEMQRKCLLTAHAQHTFSLIRNAFISMINEIWKIKDEKSLANS